jgi:hypothetical protein
MITKDVHFCSQLARKHWRTQKETLPLGQMWLKMSNIEHFHGWERCIMWW